MIVLLIALTWTVIEGILALTLMPSEAGVAIREIVYFVTWIAIVLLSFTGVAQYDSYRIFRTNERRWVALSVLTAVFLIWCSFTGWGQPMLQGIEESLVERFNQAEPSSAVAKGKEISTAAGKKLWDYFKLEKLEKNLGVEPTTVKSAPQQLPRRQFYGLASWSHWFVFVFLYPPALVLYGIAARREEVSAWVGRRRQERDERRRIERLQQPAQATVQGQPAPQQLQLRRSWIGWADLLLDLVDFLASLGAHFSRR